MGGRIDYQFSFWGTQVPDSDQPETTHSYVQAKLQPRVEKCVMALQNVDYEIVYEPGKDEKDTLDYLLRHPLPETGSDHIEKTAAAIVQTLPILHVLQCRNMYVNDLFYNLEIYMYYIILLHITQQTD